MGSLDTTQSSIATFKDAKCTQIVEVSFANLDANITAKELSQFIENRSNCAIWRCHLKTSAPPSDCYPEFKLTGNLATRVPPSPASVPHAFIHFVTPEGADRATSAAGRCELILNNRPLFAHSSRDTSFRVNKRNTIEPIVFPDCSVELGTLHTPYSFLTAWKCDEADFLVDPFDNSCKILFFKDVGFALKNSNEITLVRCEVKIEFLLRDVMDMRIEMDNSPFVMILRLDLGTAQKIYYRTCADDVYDTGVVNLSSLDEEDPWIRTTDFTDTNAFGRCNGFRICIKARYGRRIQKAVKFMKERRIEEVILEKPIIPKVETLGTSTEYFFCFQKVPGINFSNLFMVNALVHKGVFSHHRLSNAFFDLLRNNDEAFNDAMLRHIYTYRRPIFNAYSRLQLVRNWLIRFPKNLKIPSVTDDNMEVRRLVITPTKAYCLPPELELSNRVLRHYREISDRFIRVSFTDESMQKLNHNALNSYPAPIVKEIKKTSGSQKTTMFRRVKNIVENGFHLCGRKYMFLAFSSNQLRDSSAWFFAEDEHVRVSHIKSWMGKFDIKNVAKYAARLGQCFSSTYATINVPPSKTREIKDIERNNYCFSDGIGKITPDLADEIANKLSKRLDFPEITPSAYQIRYRGCKGVVAVWPAGKNDGVKLSLRPSMSKFTTSHTMFEVCSWTRHQPGFLNRQIIVLLSSLKVEDDVFETMQDGMVHKLDRMLEDKETAYEVLMSSCAEQGTIAAMMLSAGFDPVTEPHLRGMLACVRMAQLKDLAIKTRIFVNKGRWLMGCLDELGLLEQGQCFIQVSSPCVENAFLKYGESFKSRKERKEVIKGTIVFAKNPCLHPGDVRVLEAIDVPELKHLVDCLVFPQKGDRPHSNEASGSDLDGDLYFVTWDERLIPPGKSSWPPMDYTAAEAKDEPQPIVHQDILTFFIKNVSSENLGRISNAHVVHADQSDYGAMDEKCIKLAELAAEAVDFPKTGKIVKMPPSLKPKLYPDFMGKDSSLTYKSEKILGRLYRKIKDAANEDSHSNLITAYEDIPYDLDLELPYVQDYLSDAWELKCSYDRQLNALLGQYRVEKEGELVTGHICSMAWATYNSKKQGDVKERVKHAYNMVHKKYRGLFEELGLDVDDEERAVMYERKASAWYQVAYHPKWVRKAVDLVEPDGESVPPRLSFAWIAADYLVRIKLRAGHGKIVEGDGQITAPVK